MQLADLVFLLGVFALFVAALRAAGFAVRGRWADARRVGARAVVAVVVYLAVVVLVSVATPRRWIGAGEEQRFDDWAITVTTVERTASGYRVGLRVANHGRGRAQAAADAEVVLATATGDRIAPEPAPGERSLRSRVQAGDWFETVREFTVPVGAEVLGLDVRHGTAGPGWFIIGDRSSLLHLRPLVRLRTPGP